MASRKGMILVVALSMPLLAFWGNPDAQVKRGRPPVILDIYAPDVIQPGTTWRIYLHAKDDDGDMKDITAVLLEPGNVISPISFTRLKSKRFHVEFEGYLYLHTPRNMPVAGRKFMIKLQVRDRALNRSKAVKLPLTFANVPKQDIPEKWQDAANQQLGGITIDFQELDDWRSAY